MFRDPVSPLAFEVVHVPTGSDETGLIERLGSQWRDLTCWRDGLCRVHRSSVSKGHEIIVVDGDGIIGNVIVDQILHDNGGYQAAKFLLRRNGATLLLQQFQRDFPFVLFPAMFASQFIDSAFQGFS